MPLDVQTFEVADGAKIGACLGSPPPSYPRAPSHAPHPTRAGRPTALNQCACSQATP